ncbi:MAG TPA: hypothetical protein DEF41_00430 [Desulfovibrio sp.]|uniref:Uncharacterized protein n=1 Tax=Nitratidesulfovibrio vulgaris (strain ATCC 29579 / DSM 644 / CCUG 34227 / NCIMB 8303 / VKM B-1760 / Hildenborough) TaxID=882 RepID=Q72FM5_NITV2|nr:hypothetical protein DVU_0188 [Nitratidesulfovibrio vulgaris str. Hildenborough]HBW14621.1 hypothetical protein [Desulfovibrio sp.]
MRHMKRSIWVVVRRSIGETYLHAGGRAMGRLARNPARPLVTACKTGEEA